MLGQTPGAPCNSGDLGSTHCCHQLMPMHMRSTANLATLAIPLGKAHGSITPDDAWRSTLAVLETLSTRRTDNMSLPLTWSHDGVGHA